MCEAEKKAVLDSIEDASLIPNIPKGQLLPRILEHSDELGSSASQPTNLLQTLLSL